MVDVLPSCSRECRCIVVVVNVVAPFAFAEVVVAETRCLQTGVELEAGVGDGGGVGRCLGCRSRGGCTSLVMLLERVSCSRGCRVVPARLQIVDSCH